MLHKAAIFPYTLYDRPVHPVELPRALDLFIKEYSFEKFAVGQLNGPWTRPVIVVKHSIVVQPAVSQFGEVFVVVGAVDVFGCVVEDFASSMELVVPPVPLVRDFSVLVIELPETVHLVLLPLSFVVASVLVVELAKPMPHAVEFVAFVLATVFVLLIAVLWNLFKGFHVLLCFAKTVLGLFRLLFGSKFEAVLMSVIPCF